jgi:phospholipid transport system substrate-binding protein
MKNLKYSLMAAGVAWVLAAGWCPGAAPPTAPAASARAVIEKVTHDAVAILRDAKLTSAQKNEKIRQIAYENMDFEALSRLTLARYWADLSDAQRGEFVQEFKKHLSAIYSHITDDYTDEDVIVTGGRQEAGSDWSVQTRIVGKKAGGSKQEETKVDYRLRQQDDHWKIIDVTIEGISMVANFRSQFQEIMANGGIDRVLKLLREKNAAAESK